MKKSSLLAALGMLAVAGCTSAPKKPTAQYINLSKRSVPSYLQGTVYEYTDLLGTEPTAVSGYGLVTHLHGTGGSRAPTAVRAFMVKELAAHIDQLGVRQSPESILNSKDVAIVRVDGFIPPGARSALDHGADGTAVIWEKKHNPSGANTVFAEDAGKAGDDWCTWFDVRVSLPPGSDATSLAHGDLFLADLKINGANPNEPGGGTPDLKAQAAGEVFVNPKYVLDSSIDSPAAQRSRRAGVVLAGGRTLQDQPLQLRLRTPERQMARNIERLVIERFQDVVDGDLSIDAGSDAASSKKVANARDEAVINLYVPRVYANNWEHFASLVQYLYLDGGDPAFAARQAQVLADAAVQPKAPLLEISYCLEGLGKPALFAIDPLMTNPKPEVRFAAARAAAFLNDPAAVPVLLEIAQTDGDPFRVNAVQVLGDLPGTPRVDRLCRMLLDSDEAHVRLEAYKALARHGDSSVYTRWITTGKTQRFALDIVHTDSPPLVWASRQGIPRVAVFGNETSLELPLMFSALDGRLTISTDVNGQMVTIYYRGSELPEPVTVHTSSLLPEVVAALAGDGTSGGASTLHLSYADVVAVLQSLVDQQKVAGVSGQHRLLASFVLQDPTEVEVPIDSRSLLRTGSRPNSDRSQPAIAPTGERPLLRSGVDSGAAIDPAPAGVNAASAK